MAIVLGFEGDDDYAVHSGFNISPNDDFSLRIKASSASNSEHTRWVGGFTLASSTSRVIYLANSGTVRMTFDNADAEWAIGLDSTILQEVEFRRISGNLNLYIAGVLQSGGFTGNNDGFTGSRIIGANFGTPTQQGQLEYIELDINGTPVHAWDTNSSVHTAGTPIITDTIGGNDATGVNMPTAAIGQPGSAWIDLGGGGITVTGATANYNYTGIVGVIDLTGEIIVTGSTANYNYAGITGSIDLTGEVVVTGVTANYNYSGVAGTVEIGAEIIVTGQTANYNYAGIDGAVELTALITVIGQTANYDYTGIVADVIIQGAIIVTGNTANYDYLGVNATIKLQGPIVVNPRNIIMATRNSTTIRVKRNSTKIVVKQNSRTIKVR